MGMAFIGVLAILFGGASGGSQSSGWDGIFATIAVILYLLGIYAYWVGSALGLIWATDAVGLSHGISIFVVLLGPIVIPMFIIECFGKH